LREWEKTSSFNQTFQEPFSRSTITFSARLAALQLPDFMSGGKLVQRIVARPPQNAFQIRRSKGHYMLFKQCWDTNYCRKVIFRWQRTVALLLQKSLALDKRKKIDKRSGEEKNLIDKSSPLGKSPHLFD